MESTRVAETRLTPDAAEFVRFCYRRRAVGWPDLYDEMCAVANRGLFRGWGSGELAVHGIGFGLFELAELAALTRRIVVEEQTQRRGATAAARTAARVEAAPIGEGAAPFAAGSSMEADADQIERIAPALQSAPPLPAGSAGPTSPHLSPSSSVVDAAPTPALVPVPA